MARFVSDILDLFIENSSLGWLSKILLSVLLFVILGYFWGY